MSQYALVRRVKINKVYWMYSFTVSQHWTALAVLGLPDTMQSHPPNTLYCMPDFEQTLLAHLLDEANYLNSDGKACDYKRGKVTVVYRTERRLDLGQFFSQ